MSNDLDNPSQPPSVQAQVQPTTAHLGDLVTLSIRVTHPNADTIRPPVFQKSLGTFEVYSSTRLPTQVEGPNQSDFFEAQLQNFTTGQQLLPGLELGYRDILGHDHLLKTPDLQVTIEEVPAGPKDKGDIRGIKGVIGPVGWSPWWWLVAAVLIAALCALLWHKRKRVLEGPPPPPPVPADEAALKKLQELLATGWLDSGKLKEFYSGLSDIVRGYIENGFQCPALERTTSEILRDLRKIPQFDAHIILELRELLEEGDLVKFAKFKPEVAEALRAHERAVQIVEQTKEALIRPPATFSLKGEGPRHGPQGVGPLPSGRGSPKGG